MAPATKAKRRQHVQVAASGTFGLIGRDAQMVGDEQRVVTKPLGRHSAQALIVGIVDCGPMLRIAIPNFIGPLLKVGLRTAERASIPPAIRLLHHLMIASPCQSRSNQVKIGAAEDAGRRGAATAAPSESNGDAMDFSYTPEQEAFRMEVRHWLADNLPPELCIDDPADERVPPNREHLREAARLAGRDVCSRMGRDRLAAGSSAGAAPACSSRSSSTRSTAARGRRCCPVIQDRHVRPHDRAMGHAGADGSAF